MTYPNPSYWDRRAGRRGELDSHLLIGRLATGTYCVPSCPVVSGRRNVVLFQSEGMARAAGLRPCRDCHPDRIHRDTNARSLSLFDAMSGILSTDPARIGDVDALASVAGLDSAQLATLAADHPQLTPAAWLDRERVHYAARRIVREGRIPRDLAEASGFTTAAALERTFTRLMSMTPGEYLAALGHKAFALRLPTGYRHAEVLAYQGRDPEGLAERVSGAHIDKALMTLDGPAIVHVALGRAHAKVEIESPNTMSRDSVAQLHLDVIKILGLTGDATQFELQHGKLAGARAGLRVPLIPRAFDALSWAIIGQQINLAFAGSLRRFLIDLAGTPVGSMKVHPTPEALADVDASTLLANRFSRAKVKYLLSAAEAVATGVLAIEDLWRGSALKAEAALTAQHGIGTWTARYVMMRIGFGDAAPVGDSGLAAALQRWHQLDARPDASEVARLMVPYAPWRSLASAHLWAYLAE